MVSTTAVILSAALLTAMILNLALKPSFSGRLIVICMAYAVIAGLLFYGVGLYETTGDLARTAVRTPQSVVRMVLGVNELR